MKMPITKRQHEVLECVRSYHKTNGYMPTLRDIGEAMGLGRSTVRVHLRELEKRGRIVIKKQERRGIVLLAQR